MNLIICIIAILLLVAIVWRYTRDKSNKDQINKIAFLNMGIFLILFPVLLANMIWNCDFLESIPGDGNLWFDFWGSYLGAIVTVIIAVLTFRINQKSTEQTDNFMKLLTGYNLRLDKVIIAQYLPKQGKDYAKYRISIKFNNASYAMIDNITIHEFKIQGEKVDLVGDSTYRLQGDSPIVDFTIELKKGLEAERAFTDFYFMDYQMRRDCVKVELNASGHLYGDKKSFLKKLTMTWTMTIQEEKDMLGLLLSTSTNEELCNPFKKVYIHHYSVEECGVN